jgi:ornithine cyclodeaminase/alanine dehydrogenase-like protein (mu-crystallin family)
MYVASIGASDGSNKRREIDDETIRRADVYVVHAKAVAQQDQSPDIWGSRPEGHHRLGAHPRDPGSGGRQGQRPHPGAADHPL